MANAIIASLTAILLMLYPDPGPAIDACPLPAENYTNHGLMSLYDPELGGGNCDGDCGTVAMGLFHESMYGVAGACDESLYGSTIYFPYLGLRFYCVDNGSAIETVFLPHFGECGTYFDVAWPLHRESPPEWTMWSLEWEVVDDTGAWAWYQAEIAPHFEETTSGGSDRVNDPGATSEAPTGGD